jgi:hypothetical protein
MRLRAGSGPADTATIRPAALNIKDIPDKASLEVRRKTLGSDDGSLLAALIHPMNELQAIPLAEDLLTEMAREGAPRPRRGRVHPS